MRRGEVFIPTAEFFGRSKNYKIGKEKIRYPRTPRFIAGRNEFGDTAAYSLRELRRLKSRIHPPDYPHLEAGGEVYLSSPFQRRSFATLRRKKTTIGGFKIDSKGDRHYRWKKEGGFGSLHEKKAVAEIRRQRQPERAFFNAGVGPDKLRLVTVYESQFSFKPKEPRPTKPGLVNRKIRAAGGHPHHRLDKSLSIRPEEWKRMQRQKRRNQRLASRATIYRY